MKIITKIVAGNNVLLVLYQSGEVLSCKLNQEDKSQLVCERVKQLTNKNIVDIEANCQHWIAFEKTIIPPITEWNYKQTQKWFYEIDYPDCSNLAKYHKIDGKTVAEADVGYFEDALGITDVAKQQRLRYEINKVREPSFENINLYGWGANHFGQLGLIDKNLTQPKKIPLPTLTYKDDYILRFSCGRRNTAILTKKGELWITGNYKYDFKKSTKINDPAEDNEVEDKETKKVSSCFWVA